MSDQDLPSAAELRAELRETVTELREKLASLEAENRALKKSRTVDWVNCPICHEPDMSMTEEDEEGQYIIHCVNLGCPSNIPGAKAQGRVVGGALKEIARWMDTGGPSSHEAEEIGMALSGPVGCSDANVWRECAKRAFLEAARLWEENASE